MPSSLLPGRRNMQSWTQWGAVAPLSALEVSALLADREARSSVMSARAAFRDKAAGTVPCDHRGVAIDIQHLQPKCRVVLRGFADPHVEQLDRHALVALKSSLHILI
eukprot:5228291-Amphidinium_carterae.2